MDITRDWVSSFMMLCQAFTAADFSYCLFVGLSAFSFVFSEWNACSIGLQSGDWLGHCRIIHFLPSKTPGLLLQYALGHRPFVLCSAIQSTLLHLAESGQWIYFTFTFTFMHLADAFIQSDLNCIQVTVFKFYQLLLSLGIEPMILALLAPCSTIWATGKLYL